MIGALAERRVEHALAAELADQALGHAEHAAPGIVFAGRAGAAGDVLAHQDHARVAPHFLAQRLIDGLPEAFFAHGEPPQYAA